MNKDLRTFIDHIRKLGPDYFVSVSKELDTKYEPCVIQQKLAANKRFPVIYCERMKGSRLPLLTNLFGSYELLGLALGIESGKPKNFILERYRDRIKNTTPVKEIGRERGFVKEIALRGDEVD